MNCKWYNWMNLRNMILSKRSQIQKSVGCGFHLCELVEPLKLNRNRNESSYCVAGGVDYKEARENYLVTKTFNSCFRW